MARVLQALIMLAVLFLLGCSSKPPQKVQKDRFLAFAKDGFRANAKEMASAFEHCFEKGDLAAKYDEILKTAHRKTEKPDPATVPSGVRNVDLLYTWDIDDGKDGMVFVVFVGKNPPEILDFEVGIWVK